MKNFIAVLICFFFFYSYAFASFPDVYFGSHDGEAIEYLQSRGIIEGYRDGTYKPDNKINRAEFLKILIESKNDTIPTLNSCFLDVNDEWYAPYICYAKKLGVVGGYPDGYFRPGQYINLAEALKIVFGTYQIDVAQRPGQAWYQPYLDYALKKNISYGLSGFTADMEITRGEMAIIIFNLESNLNNTHVDLRPLFDKFNLKIKDQKARGICSIMAITALYEFEYSNRYNTGYDFSEEYLNWASNKVTGQYADGSFFSDALLGFNEYGLATESAVPLQPIFNPDFSPSDEIISVAQKLRGVFSQQWIKIWDINTGLTNNQLQKIKDAIYANHPVAVGLRWPKRFDLKGGTMIMPAGPDDVVDGHSILLVGYNDDSSFAGGGYFIFRNSVGESFVFGGYGYMPYDYAMHYANDVVYLK